MHAAHPQVRVTPFAHKARLLGGMAVWHHTGLRVYGFMSWKHPIQGVFEHFFVGLRDGVGFLSDLAYCKFVTLFLKHTGRCSIRLHLFWLQSQLNPALLLFYVHPNLFDLFLTKDNIFMLIKFLFVINNLYFSHQGFVLLKLYKHSNGCLFF